jgi:hypothetical protein
VANWFAGIFGEKEARHRRDELAMKHHPDRGGDTATMSEINQQYDDFINGRDGRDISKALVKVEQNLARRETEYAKETGSRTVNHTDSHNVRNDFKQYATNYIYQEAQRSSTDWDLEDVAYAARKAWESFRDECDAKAEYYREQTRFVQEQRREAERAQKETRATASWSQSAYTPMRAAECSPQGRWYGPCTQAEANAIDAACGDAGMYGDD